MCAKHHDPGASAEQRCIYCEELFDTQSEEFDVIVCNGGAIRDLSNEETCESCENCCPGHCYHCGGCFEDEVGGKFLGGYSEYKSCSYEGCEALFHFESSWCLDGDAHNCKEKKEYYCSSHAHHHIESCESCSKNIK
jgi:hypothetical protein